VLSKKFRLSRREIEELKSEKNKILQGRFFGLIFQPQKEEKKFALITSNKISKKATVRNKFKRLFFQGLKEKLTELPSGNYLFLAKRQLLEANFEGLEKEIVNFINIISTFSPPEPQ